MKDIIQSIAIPKSKFTRTQANKFIHDNGFKVSFGNKKGPDITTNFFRYRQHNPKNNLKTRLKKLPGDIYLIVEFKGEHK